MNIVTLLDRAARANATRPALVSGTTVLHDYAGLLRVVRQRGQWLLSLGLQPGDRVVLCMANRPEYLELLYATLWAGLTVVPVNTKLHAREVEFIVRHCAAKLLVSDHLAELGLTGETQGIDVHHLPDPQVFGELSRQSREGDDIAWLFYTSGTTGRPKGAMLTHANLQAMTLGYRSNVETVAADDAYVYAAPISHGAGLYTFAYTASAARHVIPRTGGFDAAEVLDLAAELNKLCMFAAPTMVNRLVDEAARRGAGGGGIKSIVYGGGPMYVADIARALEVMGPRLAQIYGQGETPMTITCMTRSEVAAAGRYRDERRLASVGRSQSVVEVKVVDADGQACRAETPGEIIVRGPTVMKGYWGDELATASALRRNWLYTGDIGSFDAQGFLTLRDRSKDVIISGGANIYAREVEEVLLEHPGIAEASVIGAPDPEWGEKVVAFIVATGDRNNGGPSDAQLDELCLSRVARFKRPKEYVRLDGLPKNHNGKILKTRLRELYAQMGEAAG
jgi:long-chain acyl-CoA synthetase